MHLSIYITSICTYHLCSYLNETMNFLLATLRKDKDRSAAFLALGLMAISVGHNIFRHLPRIMEVIRGALPGKDLPQKYVCF